MLANNNTGKPSTRKKPKRQNVTLIYRNGKFVPPPPVHVIKGDTLNFKCDTDLGNAEMMIRIKSKKYFRPAKFTIGGPPVEVVKPLNKGRRYGYVCQFDGTLGRQPVSYGGPAGGFIVP